ncbi:MAG: ferredoxin--NADP reductase, partial [Candidatus Eisenbacteria bacterium]|nr:ferredoxin--NADP reductase [Candidatus Eisenbacteria bacterium]
QAGQYATLVVETENGKIARPYSICSAPGDKTLEFYCDLEPRGEFTPLAWDMTVGSEIYVQDEAGGSLLFNPDLDQHLMVATVTGAGPFISMIRKLKPDPQSHKVRLLHGCSYGYELGDYQDELTALAVEPWFSYTPVMSRPWSDPHWEGERGRAEDVFRKYLDQDLTDKIQVYACGHTGMVANIEAMISRAGLPPKVLRRELYV